ncbi:MAG TPA: (d)CMP kinase, partial [Acidimicrobiia bacterium]|nr:(d)CMP kinase [Acidimicrobiia bacterium]HKN90523.1 (d)CMP kinase [Acidimicrobiia bacterium]HMC81521.1 (d)CMP kinase [Acidimicrobiia bacterium]HTC81911.1 (d)CMP kinase [Acidimicrobiia bacterium]
MTTPKNPVVAIDGPAGSGKSTVARAVAEALGFPTLDTGAMYRALTWAVLDAGIDPADAPAVIAVAERLDLDVGPPVRVGGRDANDAIRSAEVTAAVSTVAAVPEVRVRLVAAQREWIEVHGGGVVEGRDIGTVVAPDAVLKVYLVASEEERARRRQRQDDVSEAAGDLDATQAAIRRRDAIDSGRAASPLAAADDAVVLDTTGLSVDGVVAEVLARYRAAVAAAERP